MKKPQLQVEEGFIIAKPTKTLITVSPEKISDGYRMATIPMSPEQMKLIEKQINSGVAFKLMHRVKDGKIELTFTADKIDIKADYNFQTIEITQDQWDELRYNFMTGINDAKGITKLCYLQ